MALSPHVPESSFVSPDRFGMADALHRDKYASHLFGTRLTHGGSKTSSSTKHPSKQQPILTNSKQHKIKTAEFDSTLQTMQGFQRVVSNFHTDNFLRLPASLVKVVALTPVGKLAWKDNKLRLVGGLPVSTDLVLVLIQCDSSSGAGTITVCCDNAVAVNSIMNTLKRAIA